MTVSMLTSYPNKNEPWSQKWIESSEGVFIPSEKAARGIISIQGKDIDELKAQLLRTSKKRARLCAHVGNESALHQMVIAVGEQSYIRPHRHLNKVESFHMIEGRMNVLVFSEDGKLIRSIPMAAPDCADPSTEFFFYRLDKPYFHTLLLQSNCAVFQEITQGPFDRRDSEYASWAPSESDQMEGLIWVKNLVKENGLEN